MVNWKNIKYFKKKDFACKCNRHNEFNPALPEYAEISYYYICRYFLDPLRKDCGRPIIVNSGGRCILHNNSIGGQSLSYHLISFNEDDTRPCAIDIYCPGLSKDAFDLKIRKNTNLEYCGYHVYVNAKGQYFMHIDWRGYKSRW